MQKEIFHQCKCLMPDDEETLEKKENLGLPTDDQWVNTSFRYDDVRVFYDWLDENDNVLGTTVITMLGERFDINTLFDEFSNLVTTNLSINGWVADIN